MKKKKIIITSIIVGVIVACASFWGGMAYANSKAVAVVATNRGSRGAFQSGAGAFGGGAGFSRGGAGGGFTSGQILSKDDKSITISIPTGGSKIIFLGSTVKISKQVDGSVSDLTTGAQVQVMGTPNSDGSITATSVQLRPTMINQAR